MLKGFFVTQILCHEKLVLHGARSLGGAQLYPGLFLCIATAEQQ